MFKVIHIQLHIWGSIGPGDPKGPTRTPTRKSTPKPPLPCLPCSGGPSAEGPVARTVIQYRPGFRAEAARLAADLHVKAISPLDGLKTSDLLGAQIALILGT